MRAGGKMLLKVAVVILVAWLLGLIGVFNAGGLTHVPLLVGLMCCCSRFSGLATTRCDEPAIAALTNHE
jgi:uncharacterized membrane protein